jgi:Transposase and inactivated derivatives
LNQAQNGELPLRIMFQDEARFGRISDPRACWSPVGYRPTINAQMVREYVYIFGAVSPLDGAHDSLVLPRADTGTMSIFLDEVSRRHQNEHILMFVDQAGWHTSKGLKVPSNMELAYLPPYSPELNPEEQIWDELREKFFANKIFKSLNAVMDNAVKALQSLEALPDKIKSISHRDWILNPI